MSGHFIILLLFQASASHVYVIEASPEMASAARQIVEDNGLSDVITVIGGFVEDVEIPVRMMIKFRSNFEYALQHCCHVTLCIWIIS